MLNLDFLGWTARRAETRTICSNGGSADRRSDSLAVGGRKAIGRRDGRYPDRRPLSLVFEGDTIGNHVPAWPRPPGFRYEYLQAIAWRPRHLRPDGLHAPDR